MAGTGRLSAERFNIYWTDLDPTVGSEVKKTRPCVVISPNALNQTLKTVIIAPLTSQPKHYSSRIPLYFNRTNGEIMLDQMRCVDKSRLKNVMGRLDDDKAEALVQILAEMFAW